MTSHGSVDWVKSSYSDEEGANCLEWAPSHAHGTVPIRDSKTPYEPSLTFNASAWSKFIEGIKGDGPR
ncbi:DUF397 domain-containing protein [Streptomyces sp. NPDC058001]|uniref:DUF397 domain-containing protein n=1 Tax=Streptomyces sp. NPDC058001 TaxID=3346300 RepID=UPI0036E898FF